MKIRVYILQIVFFIGMTIIVSAQDVNGLEPYTKMTKTEVIAKFGQPDRYRSSESEFGLNEEYYYSNSVIAFSENGMFNGYTIRDNSFAIMTLEIPDGVKVGDSLSKFQNCKYGMPKYESKFGCYRLWLVPSDSPLDIIVKDGIIIAFDFCIAP